jgi:hypothetical protein
MMEAASSSETSVNFYQTTRRNNPEDSHLHARRRENLKSCLCLDLLVIIRFIDYVIICIVQRELDRALDLGKPSAVIHVRE